MLERPALVTYVPAHGGWMDDGTSCLGAWGNWYSFEEFGKICGSAVSTRHLQYSIRRLAL